MKKLVLLFLLLIRFINPTAALMKKPLLLFFIFLNFNSFSQIPFERTYGEFYYHEYGFETYQSSDSSYIMLGLYDFDSLTFLKFSPSGNLDWDHKITLTSTNSYYYMHRYDENNYLVTLGASIRKIDSLGQQLWIKSYQSNTIDGRLNPTHDSGFISIGNTGSTDSLFIISKFDSSATIVESDTVYTNSSYTYFPKFVKELADHTYLAGLDRYLDTIPLGTELFRLDTSGNILWNTLLPDDSMVIKDIISTPDSGFLLGGFKAFGIGNLPLTLKKFNAANIMTLDSTYIFSDGLYRYQIEPTRDGGVIIGCDINNSGTDLMITKFDSFYNLEWTRNFGGNDFDYFGSVRQTMDGGYIICGSKYLTGNNQDYYLIKTDSLGIVDSLFTSNASHSLSKEGTSQVTISPNPANKILSVNNSPFAITKIEIFNLIGEKVISITGTELKTIVCGDLPPGNYILQASGQDKISRGKFIKE